MILAISFAGDDHTEDVAGRLTAMGHEVKLLDLADFPAKSTVAFYWDAGKAVSYLVQNGTGGPSDLAGASVGWWRRVRPFTVDPTVTRQHESAFAESETSQAVNGMLDALPCPWINPRQADTAAHHKPLQWTVARQVGLTVPKTLVTSNPERAREFIAGQRGGGVVFKAFLAMMEAWRETRLVEQEDLDRLDLVRLAPVIFQEYIAGVDLRVTIIGKQIFAAEIDATDTAYPVDMRMVVGDSKVRPVTLPAKVSRMLFALMKALHLVYGAIDLKRTSSGDYYFLEVNPAGQWLFTERLAGLPISQAMADHLAAFDRQASPGRGRQSGKR